MKQVSRVILSVLVGVLIAIPMSAMADVAPPLAQFVKAVHFQDQKGEDVLVAPGIYRVEGIEKTLHLTPADGGNPLILAAGVSPSTETIEETVVEALPSEEDDYVLILHHVNGQTWTATGSFSGIRGRGNLASAQNQLHFACTMGPYPPDQYGSEAEAAAHYQKYNGPECVAYRAKLYAQKRKESLLKCLDSVRNGPTRKDISLFGHDFNCKPASIVKKGNQIQISGELSHNIRFQPDDQVEYKILKTYDPQKSTWTIAPPDVNIKRGGWGKIAGIAAEVAVSYFGSPIPGSVAGPITEVAVDKLTDAAAGDWRKAAHKTIAAIALKVP